MWERRYRPTDVINLFAAYGYAVQVTTWNYGDCEFYRVTWGDYSDYLPKYGWAPHVRHVVHRFRYLTWRARVDRFWKAVWFPFDGPTKLKVSNFCMRCIGWRRPIMWTFVKTEKQ